MMATNKIDLIFRVLKFKQIPKEKWVPHDFIDTEYVREWKFHPSRRWRFDFAVPALMVAYEFDGIVYKSGKHPGRHLSPKGFTEDVIKINTATLMGWKVYRITYPMLKDGQAYKIIEESIK